MATAHNDKMATTPEAAGDYLSRMNFKNLMEWLTAEAILHRPDDPLTFVRDLSSLKISERQRAYDPEDATMYVQQCYNDAAASADEHGRIYGSTTEAPKDHDVLDGMMGIVKEMTSVEKTRKNIASEAATMVGAARGYFEKFPAQFDGIAAEKVLCNVADAPNDSRFDRSADRTSGMPPTLNFLCTDKLLVVNKETAFTRADEITLTKLGDFADLVLSAATLCRNADNVKKSYDTLIHFLNDVTPDTVNEALETFVPSLLRCDACQIFELLNGYRIVRKTLDAPITENGIPAACARDNAVIHLPEHPDEDPRFSDIFDRPTSSTTSLLCVPIVSDGTLVGVAHLVNGPFTDADINLLTTLLHLAAKLRSSSPPLDVTTTDEQPAAAVAEQPVSSTEPAPKLEPPPQPDIEFHQPSLVEEHDDDDDD